MLIVHQVSVLLQLVVRVRLQSRQMPRRPWSSLSSKVALRPTVRPGLEELVSVHTKEEKHVSEVGFFRCDSNSVSLASEN